MEPRRNSNPRVQKSKEFQAEGPNWVFIAGGAVLSSLSIRLGYKIKQFLDMKQLDNAGKGKSTHKRSSGVCMSRSDVCSDALEGSGDLNYLAAPEMNRENGVIWASSPDRLELPRKPFHYSNTSESLSVSESGSGIFTKREVIHQLRQQLKRRDEMILEMQNKITELQSSLGAQLTHSTALQSQLDTTNRELFESDREVRWLRKVVSDHCVGYVGPLDKPSSDSNWRAGRNGHVNGYINGERDLELVDKRGGGDRITMLKSEVEELMEVVEGKDDSLMQSYKEQKVELSSEMKELEQR